jgi:hypothetical protein
MKIITILKLLAGGVLFLLASVAGAATVLIATDGDVNFLFGDLGDYELYMFDDDDEFGDTTENLNVTVPSLVGISGPSSDASGLFHLATNEIGDTLRLDGIVPQFVLGLSDDNGQTFLMDTGAVDLGANSLQLTFENSGTLLTVDVITSPVPLPAAVWLFGSAMVGLVVVGRRKLAGEESVA